MPTRKSGLTELKISGITTDWSPENKYEYKSTEVSKHDEKLIVARVVEK